MVLLRVSSIAMAGPRARKLPQVLERALQALEALAKVKVLPGGMKRRWRDRLRWWGALKRWCRCKWVLHLPGLMLASIMGWISSVEFNLLSSS